MPAVSFFDSVYNPFVTVVAVVFHLLLTFSVELYILYLEVDIFMREAPFGVSGTLASTSVFLHLISYFFQFLLFLDFLR